MVKMHMTPQAVAEAALKPCTHCSGWAPHRRNVHRETGEVAHYQENYGAACQLAARARDWDNKKKRAEEKKRKRESLAVDPVVGPAPVDPVVSPPAVRSPSPAADLASLDDEGTLDDEETLDDADTYLRVRRRCLR